jgi:hypothetical protein
MLSAGTLSIYPDSIACDSTSDCLAVGKETLNNLGPGPGGGSAISTVNGGTTWISDDLPTEVAEIDQIVCPSTSKCLTDGLAENGPLVNLGPLGTSNGGTSWSFSTFPASTQEPSNVVCPSKSVCYGTAYDAISGTEVLVSSSNGGSTWTIRNPSGYEAVACATTAFCIANETGSGATAGTIAVTSDSWKKVSLETLPQSVFSVSSGACPSTSECFVTGTDRSYNAFIDVSTDGGMTWTSQTLPSGVTPDYLVSVTCPSISECFVGGNDASGGVLLGTSDSGSIWTNETLPVSVYYVMSISCTSVSSCVAAAPTDSDSSVILTTTTAGNSWTSVDKVKSWLNDLTCPSLRTCFAVGSTTSNGGLILKK